MDGSPRAAPPRRVPPPHRSPRVGASLALLAVPLVTGVLAFLLVVNSSTAAGVVGGRGGDRLLAPAGSAPATVRFDVPAMIPGDTAERCVLVATPPGGGELRVHGVSGGELVDHLRLAIGHGAAGASCASPGSLTRVYDGPLAAIGRDFASGSGGHRAAPADAPVAYLVAVTLDPAAPDGAQGRRADLALTWEVRPGPADG